jgi:PAS domain S-box-containing protein
MRLLLRIKIIKIISVNKALEKITGYSQFELLGKDPKVFSSHQHDALFYQAMWQELLSTDSWKGEI